MKEVQIKDQLNPQKFLYLSLKLKQGAQLSWFRAPGLTFKVGDEVTFSVNATGHPFYLKTVAGTGTGNQISGVTNNGTTSGSVVWTPTAAGTYYYQCGPHAEMVGTITIQN